jgi:hypothetical protein
MNHFELFAHGAAFDVDAYVGSSSLPVTRVWRRGQRHYKTSGVAVALGDGEVIPTFVQERLAIEFLTTHREELLVLRRRPGVDVVILGLQLRVRLEEGLVGFCVGPSTALMRSALAVGAEPFFFVALEGTRPSSPP